MTRVYGISPAVCAYVETLHPGATFDGDKAFAFVQRRVADATRDKVVSAIGRLLPKHIVAKTEVKGVYKKPNGDAHIDTPPPKRVDVERAVLDALLDAMAEAEPVLQRCKKLLAVLDSVD